jgi:two-component system, chemotaxis family, sensor kinase CheA
LSHQNTTSNSLVENAAEYIIQISVAACTLATESENQAAITSLVGAYTELEQLFKKHNRTTEQALSCACKDLLNLAAKRVLHVDRRLINIILNSVNLLEKLLGDEVLEKDPDFIALTEKNIEAFKRIARERLKDDVGKQDGGFLRLGDILVDQKIITDSQVQNALGLQKSKYKKIRLGEILIREKLVHARDIIRAIRHQEDLHKNLLNLDADKSFADDKISVFSLLLEELIMAQTLLEQHSIGAKNREIVRNVHRLSKGIGELQAFAMDLKTISLADIFEDLLQRGNERATEIGRCLYFEVTGSDTKVDRQVAEALVKPISELINNALLHGIETEHARLEKGKSPVGTLRISAQDNRGAVSVSVSDNGRGLDLDAIFDRAVAAKIADPKRSYGPLELVNFLFHPHFCSNAEAGTTDLAALQTQLAKAGGRLSVESKPDQGCCFTIWMPLNLAVVAGSIARIGKTHYIIPTDNIVKIFSPKKDQWISVGGQKTSVKDKNRIIPIASSGKLFGLSTEAEFPLIVVLELNGKLLGLPGNEIIGERNCVIRRFSHNLWEHHLVSGASIMGDGNIAMMLNLEALFDSLQTTPAN